MQIWAESGKSALPICNYSQILYRFLAFTQNLKRSLLERQPLSVKILTELYSRENLTGYAAYERIDGRLIRPEAVQLLSIK